MNSHSELIREIKLRLDDSGLQHVFVELLGWDYPIGNEKSIQIGAKNYSVLPIAHLHNVYIIEIQGSEIPNKVVMSLIHSEISKLFPAHIGIFRNQDISIWRWPKNTNSSIVSFQSFEFANNSISEYMIQRLAALHVTTADRRKLNFSNTRDMVAGQFDSSQVTKKFYDLFKLHHSALADVIEGVASLEDKVQYSSLLLNRLMFMYFLEKKGFLNNDPNYLRNCLSSIKKDSGENKFYSFYKDLLLPIFFDGLNSKTRPVTHPFSKIIGDIPYINGGIFAKSKIELRSEIQISDDIFLEIFDFFDSFNWHLDTTPGGNENEINPDVIGYIFEQYINFNSSGKRESGAYYTKPDVTRFMMKQSLSAKVLDLMLEIGFDVFTEIRQNPKEFIAAELLHGYVWETDSWVELDSRVKDAWEGSPDNWNIFDSIEFMPVISLPEETWVETLYRRERMESLLTNLGQQDICDTNSAITLGLDLDRIIERSILANQDIAKSLSLWDSLSGLSVLDPTCGSGAFLFSALECLEIYYEKLLSNLQDLSSTLISDQDECRKILQDVQSHANQEYFIRKRIALRNLFGTDLMPDAIETAKLRIFLSLAACLTDRADIEPLPDLEMNFKVGNLLVGFLDEDDVERLGGNLFTTSALSNLKPEIELFINDYRIFIEDSLKGTVEHSVLENLNIQLENLRNVANSLLIETTEIQVEDSAHWIESQKPFHWFIEFPQIISQGGFDVIVGNPPYIRATEVKDYFKLGFDTSDATDVYALCLERSQDLANPKARFSMIVPLSFCFSNDFSSLRNRFAVSTKDYWFSSFGRLPNGLFPSNVKVRNTIVSYGPGSGNNYSTRHHIWTQAQRFWLFPTIEFFEFRRKSSKDAIPRAGVAQEVIDSLLDKKGKDLRGETDIWFRPTAQYWVPVLSERPNLLDSSGRPLEADDRVKSFGKVATEVQPIFVAACASNLGYLWWSAYGDDFDITKGVLLPFLEKINNQNYSPKAVSDCVKFVDESKEFTFYTLNAGKGYVNIRYSSMQSSIAKIDKLFIQEFGWPTEYQRRLAIWWRMSMRGIEAGAKSRPL